MRTLAKICLDTAAASAAIQNDTLGRMIQESLAAIRPEAAYFTLAEGKRTAYIVFDMKEPGDMVPTFEPWMIGAGATIELTPVMTAEDVGAGLQRFQASKSHA
jgi:hypothetical protein